MSEKMRYGTINCSCGQLFYFETVKTKVHCIKCRKEHDVLSYPFKDEVAETGEADEVDETAEIEQEEEE